MTQEQDWEKEWEKCKNFSDIKEYINRRLDTQRKDLEQKHLEELVTTKDQIQVVIDYLIDQKNVGGTFFLLEDVKNKLEAKLGGAE